MLTDDVLVATAEDSTGTEPVILPVPCTSAAHLSSSAKRIHVFSRVTYVPSPSPSRLTDASFAAQIAIDSAIFPEGTSGAALDVLTRRALWKDGLNYLVSVFPI